MDEFEEIQFVGKNCFFHKFTAKILPDRYLIKDMLELSEGRWIEISESEYDSVYQSCKKGIQE